MQHNKLAAIKLCTIVFMIIQVESASAGWFWTSTYEECVLKKSNQQRFISYDIMRMIKASCRESFPCPDIEPDYLKGIVGSYGENFDYCYKKP